MKHISSRDNPFFRELKQLAGSSRQRRKSGQALLDGVHLLQAWLDAGNQPLHVLVTGAALQDAEIAALLQRIPGIPVTQLDEQLFAALTELKSRTGILTLIAPPAPKLKITQVRCALLLEDIQDPGNLGSMIRSAAASGCDAVFLSKGCADAWSPRVLRSGMGGQFVLDVHESADLVQVASQFKGQVFAAALHAGTSLYECDLRGMAAFAIGNEGAGLSETMQRLAIPLTIPMPGRVESLNAAAAAAVCLFEATRQRLAAGR